MKPGNVVVGILGGLATGVVLGILFAPDKGSNTRKKIAQKTSDLKNNLKDGFNDFLTSVEDQYHSLTSKAEVMADEGRDKLEKTNRALTK